MTPAERLLKYYQKDHAKELGDMVMWLFNKNPNKMNPEFMEQVLTALDNHKPMELRKLFELEKYKSKDGNDHLEPLRRWRRGEIDFDTASFIGGAQSLYRYARDYKNSVPEEDIKVNMGPTGIANPAEYMSSVTKTEEDTNGDGNIDKVTIEKENDDNDLGRMLSDERLKNKRYC